MQIAVITSKAYGGFESYSQLTLPTHYFNLGLSAWPKSNKNLGMAAILLHSVCIKIKIISLYIPQYLHCHLNWVYAARKNLQLPHPIPRFQHHLGCHGQCSTTGTTATWGPMAAGLQGLGRHAPRQFGRYENDMFVLLQDSWLYQPISS